MGRFGQGSRAAAIPGQQRPLIDTAGQQADIVLTDTSGQRYDFRARTTGLVTLLFFGYTHCPDEGRLTTSKTQCRSACPVAACSGAPLPHHRYLAPPGSADPN